MRLCLQIIQLKNKEFEIVFLFLKLVRKRLARRSVREILQQNAAYVIKNMQIQVLFVLNNCNKSTDFYFFHSRKNIIQLFIWCFQIPVHINEKLREWKAL